MKRNVIVGQSGGPTAAINSSLAGIYVAAKERGAAKVYGMIHGVQGLLEETYVDLSAHLKNDLDIEILKRTPSAFLGSCRFKLPEVHKDKELYDKLFAILEKLDIEAFFYIGGNDSMDTIKKLADYALVIGSDIKFVGCPKTVDNDLAVTDHTPGYGSAAKYIGTSVKEAIRDASSIELKKGQVTVIEIMGRNAGWLTGAAALAGTEEAEGPDLIYLPEVAFDLEAFKKKVGALLKEKYSVVVCVSEGIHTADGTYVCELGASTDYVDAFGHKQLSGTASYLASYCAGEFDCKARSIELSTLQRAGAHLQSEVDILESFQVGGAAVKAADEGDSGKMAVYVRVSNDPYQFATAVHDVHKIANEEKVVPREWINGDGDYVKQEFIDYVTPLIQGEVEPIFVNGIPRHLPKPFTTAKTV
ncbi:MAG: 6-phosphofructokinase [Lachnospiraceae bacterium]|jgi:6-phosphofructokinase 1|nr:6-phosphofructokinase [Lachnospiraceae bacterium]